MRTLFVEKTLHFPYGFLIYCVKDASIIFSIL
ncbi:MAG: hypothetical protein JWN78_159 [Bacteroidota bacterium]|nr:hypothetical protein [Bacteroidota bacterium]